MKRFKATDCRQDFSVQEEVGMCEEGGRSCEEDL